MLKETIHPEIIRLLKQYISKIYKVKRWIADRLWWIYIYNDKFKQI